MDDNIARTIKTKNANNVTMDYLLLMFNLLIVVYFLDPSILKKSTLEMCCFLLIVSSESFGVYIRLCIRNGPYCIKNAPSTATTKIRITYKNITKSPS